MWSCWHPLRRGVGDCLEGALDVPLRGGRSLRGLGRTRCSHTIFPIFEWALRSTGNKNNNPSSILFKVLYCFVGTCVYALHAEVAFVLVNPCLSIHLVEGTGGADIEAPATSLAGEDYDVPVFFRHREMLQSACQQVSLFFQQFFYFLQYLFFSKGLGDVVICLQQVQSYHPVDVL